MAVIGRLRNNHYAVAIQSHINYSGSAGTHRGLKNHAGKIFFADFHDFFSFSRFFQIFSIFSTPEIKTSIIRPYLVKYSLSGDTKSGFVRWNYEFNCK